MLLAQLLEATPEPPAPDDEPLEVLEAAQRLVRARAPLLEALKAVEGNLAQDPECQRLTSEIVARDTRWEAALVCARRRVASRLASLHARHARF